MGLSQNFTLLLIGTGIGLAFAVIGGFAEYWSSLRTNGSKVQHRLPGCLLYAAGGLALAGIIAMVASFYFSGSIGSALVLGAGVLGGFYIGFACLFFLWIFIER